MCVVLSLPSPCISSVSVLGQESLQLKSCSWWIAEKCLFLVLKQIVILIKMIISFSLILACYRYDETKVVYELFQHENKGNHVEFDLCQKFSWKHQTLRTHNDWFAQFVVKMYLATPRNPSGVKKSKKIFYK